MITEYAASKAFCDDVLSKFSEYNIPALCITHKCCMVNTCATLPENATVTPFVKIFANPVVRNIKRMVRVEENPIGHKDINEDVARYLMYVVSGKAKSYGINHYAVITNLWAVNSDEKHVLYGDVVACLEAWADKRNIATYPSGGVLFINDAHRPLVPPPTEDINPDQLAAVREALGLGLWEEFTLGKELHSRKYRFGVYELQVYAGNGMWDPADIPFNMVMDSSLTRKKFSPQPGDVYYSYSGKDWAVTRFVYSIDSPADILRYQCGIVFQTREAAAKVRDQKRRELCKCKD